MMNKKIWTALLLPFALSLAALPAEAESIPVQRKAVISSKSSPARRAPSQRNAAVPKAENKTSSLGPDVEVGLLTSGEVTVTGLADFKAESAGKVVGKYGNGTRLSISRSGNTILLNATPCPCSPRSPVLAAASLLPRAPACSQASFRSWF